MDFSFLQHAYAWHALIAGFCAGVTCALAGVFVVTMHLAFLGVCIAHAAFAGGLMGVWLGFNPLIGALVFSLGVAALVGPMADQGDISPDATIGILFSMMIGLAFLFIGLVPGSRSEALNLFWGSILTVSRTDLAMLIAATVIITGGVALFFKEIQAVLCHRHVAMAVGIPATLVFYGMLFATGLTIAVSLRIIGGLLIYSLLINPAAAAYQLTYNLKRMMLLACLFGVLSCWTGLAASFLWDLPAGASIVLASCAIFAAAALFSPKKRVNSWKQARTVK